MGDAVAHRARGSSGREKRRVRGGGQGGGRAGPAHYVAGNFAQHVLVGHRGGHAARRVGHFDGGVAQLSRPGRAAARDRKSTRLNSSHVKISYAVFCLKKKTNKL